MIRFEHIHVHAGGKKILHDVSLHICKGEKVSFCGKSGSGKTTILKTLLGAYIPNRGTVYYHDQPVTARTISSLRNQIAYIGQEPIMGADQVHEALLLPFSFKAHKGIHVSDKQIRNILTEFALSPDILTQKSSSLSGGQKQRVVIARAALLGKSIFVADEITSALDKESKYRVVEYFFRSKHTVISVSHDEEWLKRCDRIFTIENGIVTGEKIYECH